MRKYLNVVAVLGSLSATMSCENSQVKPSGVAAKPAVHAIKEGEPIINPLPETLQKPGFGFELHFGRGTGCPNRGVCFVKGTVEASRIVKYPVAGQGTGFFSAPEYVDPETHIGTMRIIFTSEQKNINEGDDFDLTNGGTVLTLEKPGILGGNYKQLSLLDGVYKIIHGDGTNQNPYGYVDVPVLCE